jgi:hypothetical protein
MADTVEQWETNTVATWKVALCGGAAAAFSWTSCYPFDLVKAIVQTTPNVTARSVFRDKFATHGLKFFTRGMLASVLRGTPVGAVFFVFYDRLKWLCM